MFIGFNLKLTKNFFGQKSYTYNEYVIIGRQHLKNQKTNYEKDLLAYVKQNEIDGSRIQEEWFPQIEADIFISHSHLDEELACALAGWINDTFGLKCFIDSNVWGYMKELLEEMNSKLSDKRLNEKGGYLYNHESCNRVSQHVNTMLSIALQKMIDRTEAVILLNTDNSVKIYSGKEMEKTYSPWIYSEIICTQIVRRKPLIAYRDYSKERIDSALFENMQASINYSISYIISLSHLQALTEVMLNKWNINYSTFSHQYALDALYCYVCKDEIDISRRICSILTPEDLLVLRKGYYGDEMDGEESLEFKKILLNLFDNGIRCWWK